MKFADCNILVIKYNDIPIYNLQYTIMQKQTQPIQKLHTNSCIELSVPHQYRQWGTINFNWISVPLRNAQSYLAQYVTYQSRKNKPLEQSYYICSPLDIGSIVHVKIVQQRYNQNVVLQQLKYGSVEVEENLVSAVRPGEWKNVQILLNKGVKQQAQINVRQGHSFQINIIIKINNFEYYLALNENFARNQLQSFQKQPFFKLYDAQPSALGIYLFNLKQFAERIKDYNMPYNLGSYLKIYFSNRVCRDVFMLYLISLTDTSLECVKQFKKQFLEQQELHKNKQSGKNIPQRKSQLSAIPKIQSTVRKSQINGFQCLNSYSVEPEVPRVQEDILQDIYNILYTPITKIERESFHLNSKSAKTQEKSLPSAITISANATLNQDDSDPNQSTNFTSNLINKNENSSGKDLSAIYEGGNKNQKSFGYQKNEQTWKKENVLLKPNLGKKISIASENNCYFQPEKDQLVNSYVFKRETQLIDKINELTKINEILMNENRRLRQENQILKSDENKKSKVEQINRMMEIKEMVQLVAQKLENLQQGTRKSQKDRKKSLTIAGSLDLIKEEPNDFYGLQKNRNYNQHGKVQNKKMWSPEAHEQIVKNIRLKTGENLPTPKKQQYIQIFNPRKISTSDRGLDNQHYSPTHKPQMKVLKECSSAGDLTNPMAWNTQPRKKLKPKVQFNHYPNNLSVPMNNLYGSSVKSTNIQFVYEGGGRTSIQNSPKNQNYRIPSFEGGSNPNIRTQSEFRNVFH